MNTMNSKEFKRYMFNVVVVYENFSHNFFKIFFFTYVQGNLHFIVSPISFRNDLRGVFFFIRLRFVTFVFNRLFLVFLHSHPIF